MRDKGNSSPTHTYNLRLKSFKNPNSKSKSKSKSKPISTPNPNPNNVDQFQPLTLTLISKPISTPNPNNVDELPPFIHPEFTNHRHWGILTTAVYSISITATATFNGPWLYAIVTGDELRPLHPLTLKPQFYKICRIPYPYRIRCLVSFTHTNYHFDKLVILRAATEDGDAMVVLYGGGKLLGRLPLVAEHNVVKWVVLSEDKFDDIIAFGEYTLVVDRLLRLGFVTNNTKNLRYLRLATPMVSHLITSAGVSIGYRKRLVVFNGRLYLVFRVVEKLFRLYHLRTGTPNLWVECVDIGSAVLFVSKDCCFFMPDFGRKEYKDCIVFSESGFPKYGDDGGWEYNCEDEIGVFRITDRRFGRVGESADFPDIDWSPPSSVFEVREPNKDERAMQSGLKDLNAKDVEKPEGRSDSNIRTIQPDSNNQEKEDEVMQSNGNIEEDTSLLDVVSPSLIPFVSAAKEQVTRTLLVNGGHEATEKDSSKKSTTLLAPRASTSSSPAQGCKCGSATATFEGFEIRSDLVPTLQKIWRNHGNISQNSPLRGGDMIGRALESLATMVQILDNNSVESLNECQADYLSTTLSDLRIISFNVEWLSSFVEKAVKLHKSKALVDSLNEVGQLSSKVIESRGILLDTVAKFPRRKINRRKRRKKVSELIPFSGKLNLMNHLNQG